MKDNPLISVVIPAYNAGPYIEQAVDSIVNQTYPNLEILVADDCSADDTRLKLDQLASKYNNVTTYHNEENLGYLKTCNKLKAKATGDYISFQDSDDYSTPDRFEILMDYLRSNPEVDVVGSNYTKITEEGERIWTSEFHGQHEEVFGKMPKTFAFCGATFLLSRKVYQEIGGYHEYFDRVGAEDMYWVYLIMEKFRLAIIQPPLYYYRFNPTSVSSSIENKKKLFSVDLVRFLIRQRQASGTDALESNSTHELEEEIERLNQPYLNDKLLFKKKLVKRHFWNGNYGEGMKLAFGVLLRNPFQSKEFYKDLYIYLPRWIRG